MKKMKKMKVIDMNKIPSNGSKVNAGEILDMFIDTWKVRYPYIGLTHGYIGNIHVNMPDSNLLYMIFTDVKSPHENHCMSYGNYKNQFGLVKACIDGKVANWIEQSVLPRKDFVYRAYRITLTNRNSEIRVAESEILRHEIERLNGGFCVFSSQVSEISIIGFTAEGIRRHFMNLGIDLQVLEVVK